MPTSKKVTELADKVKDLPPVGQILTKITVARMNGDDKALEAAFAEGKQLLEGAGLMPQSDIVAKIDQLDKHIWTCKDRVKTLKEDAEDILQSHSAYKKVRDAQAVVDRAKSELNAVLQGDSDYNELMENIADENNDIKETKYTIGVYLVEYYAQTHAHQIEIGGEGDAREVVVTGRLGKKVKFQTNLFSGEGRSYEISDSKSTLKTEGKK